MKKILLFMLPVMALCLASCEKNNGGGLPTYGEKLVKKIFCYDEYGEFGYEYEYDEKGRLIQWTCYNNEDDNDIIYSYSYGDNVIIERHRHGDDDDVSITKYYLDDDGFLTKAEDEDGDIYSYVYSDGKLTTICYPDDNGGVDAESFLWQGDDISVYYYGSDYAYHADYTDVENKSNVNILIGDDFQTTYLPLRLKGTTSKHLPQRAYNDENSLEYEYELDSDGYVTAIKIGGYQVFNIEYYE